MRYPNGQVPRELLVERPSAGKSNCLMMPGTAVKHDRLVALAQAEYGWTPRVSGPNDGYRTLDAQWYYYRNEPPGMAAYPGTSSHGGTYNGQESGAVDYGNWGQVGVNAFFDLARRAGFEPGYFMGQHGRPYEPWHVIDWSPWAVSPKSEQEEDDMLMLRIFDGRVHHLCALGNKTFKHFVEGEPFDLVMKVSRSADDWQNISLSDLRTFLVTYGCDPNIWDFRDKSGKSVPANNPDARFMVLDPLTGKVASGNTWTAENAIRGMLSK